MTCAEACRELAEMVAAGEHRGPDARDFRIRVVDPSPTDRNPTKVVRCSPRGAELRAIVMSGALGRRVVAEPV